MKIRLPALSCIILRTGFLIFGLSSCVSDGPSLLFDTSPSPNPGSGSVVALQGLSASAGPFAAPFDSNTAVYQISVASSVTSTTLTPTFTQAGATLSVNGSTVASGTASPSIALHLGANEIPVVVTGADGITQKTYTVTLYRNVANGLTEVRSFNNAYPYGSVIAGKDGQTLYGITNSDGANSMGTVFKIKIDGTGFTVLHDFAGGTADGSNAQGTLSLSADGSKLVGTATEGGLVNKGVIFSLNLDGSNYSILHHFGTVANDAEQPNGSSVIVTGNTIFGSTELGGAQGVGAIYKIQMDGTTYSVINSFSTSGGQTPKGSMILSENKLYGTTLRGANGGCGGPGCGTLFSVNTDGSNYQDLHVFVQGSDGGNPVGDLLLVGGTLYGMANRGSTNMGTIYKIQPDGSAFMVIHNFAGGTSDGSGPNSGLSLSFDKTKLIGFTGAGGGGVDSGVVFSLPLTASTSTPITLIHVFAGQPADGAYPNYGKAVILGDSIFGLTEGGGANDSGFLFAIGLL